MITLLNTSILTTFGTFDYDPLSLEAAKEKIARHGFQSAIGHEATAEILSELLGVKIPVNRMLFEQKLQEQAIVFKLNGRPPEGKILSRAEMEAIGYQFGLLTRIA